MGWREQLRPASFRGVPFQVDSVDGQIGRRTVVHEYPGRDSASVEDLGRRVRRIKLDAFVLGDGYMSVRDQLRAAIEKAGSGQLVHPYWGEMRVSVEGEARVTESTDKGGYARFSFSVVEAGARLGPIVQVETSSRVLELTGVSAFVHLRPATRPAPAAAALAASTVRRFTVAGANAAVTAGAEGTIGRALGALRTARRAAATALAVTDTTPALLAQFAEDAAALIHEPATLASRTLGLLAAIIRPLVALRSLALASASGSTIVASGESAPGTDAPQRPAGAQPLTADDLVTVLLTLVRSFATIGLSEPPTGDPLELSNRDAVTFLFRCGGVVAGCEAAAQLPCDNFSQAQALRDEFVSQLDALQLEVQDDDLYSALADVQAALVEHFASTAADLPRVASFTPAATLPALVIAHQLYGDATRDEELVRRNRVRHPGFIPGGIALEVLSDV